MTLHTSLYDSPCGELLIGATADGIAVCDWTSASGHNDGLRRMARMSGAVIESGASPLTESCAAQLDEYFAGRRKAFDLPVVTYGTPFMRAVCAALMQIPYGSVVSYGGLATAAGNAKAVRAVASAIASNMVSIIIPCHRVIRADGNSGKYRGGTEAKRYLLGLEQIHKSSIIY